MVLITIFLDQDVCCKSTNHNLVCLGFFDLSKLFKKNIGLAGHLRLVFTSVGVGASRSRNQKRRAYNVVKIGFRFRLRSAHDLVKTRLSESEAEAEG